jgi:glycosyltransferase involved in cell wall biosynthesis
VIHSGGNVPAYVFGLLRPLLRSKPIIIYDVHADTLEESHLEPGIRGRAFAVENFFMEYVATRASDYFVVASRRLKGRLLERGIPSARIEVISNGVDVRFFRPRRKKPKSRSFFRVAYAGAFQTWQSIEALISAGETLPDNIVFRMIGFGNQDGELKRRIRERLGTRVELIDWTPRERLIPLLSDSDVLIIPRMNREVSAAFPTKFGEYAALGKPVIVTGIDETSELVKSYDCGFVSEPTVKSIADTIRQASNSSKEDLLRKGRNARKLAETELDMKMVGRKYAAMISRLLSSKGTD